jgi:hypothetical protein
MRYIELRRRPHGVFAEHNYAALTRNKSGKRLPKRSNISSLQQTVKSSGSDEAGLNECKRLDYKL